MRGGRKHGRRLLVFLLLAVVVTAFVIALDPYLEKSTTVSVPEEVELVVQRLLTQYRIDAKEVRTRRVGVGKGEFTRIERRVSVSPEFNTLGFNRDLALALAEHGATVIATERFEDKSVALHIKKDGVIIESIVFVMSKTP